MIRRSFDARHAGEWKSHDSAIGLRRDLANGSEREVKARCFPCGLAGLEPQSRGNGEGVTWETFRAACSGTLPFIWDLFYLML